MFAPSIEIFGALIVRCIGGKANICLTNEIDKEGLKTDVFDGPYHSVFGDRVKELKKPYREFVVYDHLLFYSFLPRGAGPSAFTARPQPYHRSPPRQREQCGKEAKSVAFHGPRAPGQCF